MYINNDTIIAQATAVGLAGIGVIKISGNLVILVAKKILGKLPIKRYATYTPFKNGKGEILDLGIAIFYPKPNSYTGEDILELHTHGNQIILDLIVKEILSISNNIRYAKAGEFTQRAFLNNKLDLIQAEAINDIMNANSEISVKYTLNNLIGNFSKALNNFFQQLITIKKYIEHLISFENNELDNKQIINNLIIPKLKLLNKQINSFIFKMQKNLPIKKGFKIVIAGKPNVGKSTLFNVILGYERAIVSNLKGTTRDVISEFIYLKKIPLYIIDTAGIHKNVQNIVEKKGIELTFKELKKADCIIYMIDYKINQNLNIEIKHVLEKLNNNIPIIFVFNKIDKAKTSTNICFKNKYPCIYLSTNPPQGIDILLNTLEAELKKKYILNNNHKTNFFANERQISYLIKINKNIKNVIKIINKYNNSINDMCAEELSLAEKNFDKLFGKNFDKNSFLNEIFKSFCIGK